MKYNFNTTEYVSAHGKAPAGKGNWGFIIKNAPVESIAPCTSVIGSDTLFFVPGFWTLAEAKKRASILLEANGVSVNKTICVAP